MPRRVYVPGGAGPQRHAKAALAVRSAHAELGRSQPAAGLTAFLPRQRQVWNDDEHMHTADGPGTLLVLKGRDSRFKPSGKNVWAASHPPATGQPSERRGPAEPGSPSVRPSSRTPLPPSHGG